MRSKDDKSLVTYKNYVDQAHTHGITYVNEETFNEHINKPLEDYSETPQVIQTDEDVYNAHNP